MLTLNLKSGEYLTIGEDIAIRVEQQPGATFQVSIQAPRELKILRSEVLERTGKRPAGLSRQAPKSAARQAHDAKQFQKMAEKRSQAEKARQQAAEEQTHVTEELQDILRRMDALASGGGSGAGIHGELEALRARLDSLAETTPDTRN